MNVSVDDIIKFIEGGFADIRRQASWDFSGKQVYLGNHGVKSVCLALDASKSAVEQAINRGCELLITHHPLFFAPLKGINANQSKDNLIIRAIQNNLNILSYHTNLDMAANGINIHLLSLLNVQNLGQLSAEGEISYVKLTIFTPPSHEETVLNAIDQAGGGRIGNYKRCAFSVTGTGTFTPLEGSNPYIGTQGKAEYVEEVRQEVILPSALADKVVAAVKNAHPYETPALDIMPVRSFDTFGLGNVAKLDKKHTLSEFTALLKKTFSITNIRTNSNDVLPFDKFAICSGSGGSMWKDCLRHGVNVLVTGDLKHHDALDAFEAGVCVLDIGHFHSEHVYMNFLADILRTEFNVNVFLADERPSIMNI